MNCLLINDIHQLRSYIEIANGGYNELECLMNGIHEASYLTDKISYTILNPLIKGTCIDKPKVDCQNRFVLQTKLVGVLVPANPISHNLRRLDVDEALSP